MRGRGILRLGAGIALSVALLAVLVSRVDLQLVGAALVGVAPTGLGLALAVVAVDLVIRAFRWQVLLAGIPGAGRPSLRRSAEYLTVGFLANSILPARLGDLARAYLAGAAFGTSRLATLGTILVERVADGLTMVALAILSSLVVVALAEIQTLAVEAVVLVLVGSVGLWLGAIALRRGPIARTRGGEALRAILARLATGLAGIRTARGAILVVGATLGAATTACLVAWIVAGAMGLGLTAAQVVLFTSGIALSLAIPAAPGSLGTYEFAGVLILTSFGATPERALATILVMRLVSTVPLALAGLVVTWVLHLKPSSILAPVTDDGPSVGAEPALDTAAEPGPASPGH